MLSYRYGYFRHIQIRMSQDCLTFIMAIYILGEMVILLNWPQEPDDQIWTMSNALATPTLVHVKRLWIVWQVPNIVEMNGPKHSDCSLTDDIFKLIPFNEKLSYSDCYLMELCSLRTNFHEITIKIRWRENTYPYSKVNGCTVEILEWINTYKSCFIMDVISFPY